MQKKKKCQIGEFFFLLRLGAASNSAYSGYPELWILVFFVMGHLNDILEL
jgi:hypothetical protein